MRCVEEEIRGMAAVVFLNFYRGRKRVTREIKRLLINLI